MRGTAKDDVIFPGSDFPGSILADVGLAPPESTRTRWFYIASPEPARPSAISSLLWEYYLIVLSYECSHYQARLGAAVTL
jgi:hypothetical protein